MATKPKNSLTGKRSIVNVLDAASVARNPKFQDILHRANNCPATFWSCKSCPVSKLHKCVENTRQYFQMEAFKKYKDNPQYRELIAKEHGVHL